MLLALIATVCVIGASCYYFMVLMPQARAASAHATAAVAQLKEQEQQQQRSAKYKAANKNKKGEETKNKEKVEPQKNKKKKVSSHPRYNRRIGGHSNNILAMSVSPNGEWIATSGMDGHLRVTQIGIDGGGGGGGGETLSLSCIVQSDKELGNFKDQLTNLSWSSEDDRTIIGIMKSAKIMALYRMRKKKNIDQKVKNPYELIELVKRRILLESKIGNDTITSCLVDYTNKKFCLLLTSTDATHNNVATWNVNADGSGKPIGPTATIANGNENKIRISPDGRFVCSRIESKASQCKVYELHKSKVKGEVLPVFDKISPKSIMTISPPKGSGQIVDVAFLKDGITVIACSSPTTGGSPIIQLWNLNVEYQNKQDPIMLCTTKLSELVGKGEVTMIETSASSSLSLDNRIAIATANGALHMYTYHTEKKQLVYDFTIDEPHVGDTVGDMQFCCAPGAHATRTTIYTRGQRSKDVYCWNTN